MVIKIEDILKPASTTGKKNCGNGAFCNRLHRRRVRVNNHLQIIKSEVHDRVSACA